MRIIQCHSCAVRNTVLRWNDIHRAFSFASSFLTLIVSIFKQLLRILRIIAIDKFFPSYFFGFAQHIRLLMKLRPFLAIESAPPGSSSRHIAAALAIASMAGTKDSMTNQPL